MSLFLFSFLVQNLCKSAWGNTLTTLLLTASQNLMDPSLDAVATTFPSELHRMLLIPTEDVLAKG